MSALHQIQRLPHSSKHGLGHMMIINVVSLAGSSIQKLGDEIPSASGPCKVKEVHSCGQHLEQILTMPTFTEIFSWTTSPTHAIGSRSTHLRCGHITIHARKGRSQLVHLWYNWSQSKRDWTAKDNQPVAQISRPFFPRPYAGAVYCTTVQPETLNKVNQWIHITHPVISELCIYS